MYTVCALNKEAWTKELSEKAHASSFGDLRPRELERIDFALIVSDEKRPLGYVQCIEMDAETIYWQLGGMFEYAKNSPRVVPVYLSLIRWTLERYKRITTRIQNINVRMLHLAMKMGFLIVGTYSFKGALYLELLLEGE